MVPHVQEPASQPEHNQLGSMKGSPQHGHSNSKQNDADVFDAVIGEKALDVVLADRKRNTEHARDAAKAQQKHGPPNRTSTPTRGWAPPHVRSEARCEAASRPP